MWNYKQTDKCVSLVQSHYHEGSPAGKRSLRWEGFVEKVGFKCYIIIYGLVHNQSNMVAWWELQHATSTDLRLVKITNMATYNVIFIAHYRYYKLPISSTAW